MNSKTSKLATLLGSASLLTIANAMAAQAQQLAQAQMAQAGPQEVPEQVLITGSLIRGTAAVGVPVTNLSPQDFAQTGALTTSDLFRTVPSVNVSPGAVATQSGANIERQARINLRGLDTGDAVRTLMMIDGIRFPGQGNGVCATDPSIIPSIALDRIDVLADGASATYGSDAVSGVINIVLKRAFDGAITQLRYTTAPAGKQRVQAAQLWGRTWDGGDHNLSRRFFPDSGHRLHQLLCHSEPYGRSVQSDQWRAGTDGAVQRLDAELDHFQHCGQYRDQWYAQRVQSLYALLVRRGAAAQCCCCDCRSAADEEYHLQWHRLLQQPAR